MNKTEELLDDGESEDSTETENSSDKTGSVEPETTSS